MSDFPEVDYAVDKLTDVWLSPAGKHKVEMEPQLDMLQGLITPVLSRKSSGARGAGLPVSSRAFEIAGMISGAVYGWLKYSRILPTKDMKRDLRTAWESRLALWRSKDLTESEIVSTGNLITAWSGYITELADTPRKIEIDGLCPKCHAVTFTDADGDQSRALQAWVKDGEPYAECQVCGDCWWGEPDVMRLSVTVGATLDLAEVESAKAEMRGRDTPVEGVAI